MAVVRINSKKKQIKHREDKTESMSQCMDWCSTHRLCIFPYFIYLKLLLSAFPPYGTQGSVQCK